MSLQSACLMVYSNCAIDISWMKEWINEYDILYIEDFGYWKDAIKDCLIGTGHFTCKHFGTD